MQSSCEYLPEQPRLLTKEESRLQGAVFFVFGCRSPWQAREPNSAQDHAAVPPCNHVVLVFSLLYGEVRPRQWIQVGLEQDPN